MPFNQPYIRPPYLGGGPNEAQMAPRAMPMQPMQPMAPQMPPPPLPPTPPQIPQGVNPQMMPRPQMRSMDMFNEMDRMPDGNYQQRFQQQGQPMMGREEMFRQMEEAERLERLEKSMQMKRVRGMLGE